jgi:Tol biopolymer transport system component
MMRKLIIFTLLVAGIAALIALPAATKPRGTNGKIVVNVDSNVTGQEQVYTVDPDGTDMHFLANDAEAGQWSPDGTKITLSSGGYVNVDTGAFTDLHLLGGLYPGLFMFCGVWSPNGARLACEVFGEDPSLNGIYTIRSSDGGDLQRVTTAQFDDCPADSSPNGRRLLFSSWLLVSNGQLSVVESNGNGLHKITPDGMKVDFCSGSWSPQGNQIAFSAKVPDSDRSTIWVVHSDGSGLHKIPVPGCGGPQSNPTSIGCQKPVWSPDGRKITFERHFLIPNDHYDLYTINPDGSGLSQVKDTPDLDEGGGDWGTHPLTP